MKNYIGYRSATHSGGRPEAIVMVLESGQPPRPLDPRLDLRAHSRAGPDWGHAGSGAAQLAVALAADVLGDDDRAVAVHQRLKQDLVAGFLEDGWVITGARLWAVIAAIEEDARRPGEHARGGCEDCG